MRSATDRLPCNLPAKRPAEPFRRVGQILLECRPLIALSRAIASANVHPRYALLIRNANLRTPRRLATSRVVRRPIHHSVYTSHHQQTRSQKKICHHRKNRAGKQHGKTRVRDIVVRSTAHYVLKRSPTSETIASAYPASSIARSACHDQISARVRGSSVAQEEIRLREESAHFTLCTGARISLGYQARQHGPLALFSGFNQFLASSRLAADHFTHTNVECCSHFAFKRVQNRGDTTPE